MRGGRLTFDLEDGTGLINWGEVVPATPAVNTPCPLFHPVTEGTEYSLRVVKEKNIITATRKKIIAIVLCRNFRNVAVFLRNADRETQLLMTTCPTRWTHLIVFHHLNMTDCG